MRTGFLGWLNKRLPVDPFMRDQLTGYYAPKNFNFWYFFGVLSLVALVLQLVTGIFLTMHYKVGEATAFDSVEYIMREVPFGWLLRYMHSTGASSFFIVVYLHMFRALPLRLVQGAARTAVAVRHGVYLALMAEAFMGYVLPWGNMSFWGAQVIVNLFGTIPVIGPGLVDWIRGDYGIADATLNRFFALHVVAVPLVLLLLVALHLVALRHNGSNNPDGIEIKEKKGPDGKPLDGIPFHPYYTVKDLVGVGVFLIAVRRGACSSCRRSAACSSSRRTSNRPMPLSTPMHIAPVWYFTPFYAILRAVPDQQMGALLMALSLVGFFVLPWLDRSPVKSTRYRPLHVEDRAGDVRRLVRGAGLPGPEAGRRPRMCCWRGSSPALYFAFFVLMPFYTRGESTSRVPERVTFHHD